jgi:hypothetical protein
MNIKVTVRILLSLNLFLNFFEEENFIDFIKTVHSGVQTISGAP